MPYLGIFIVGPYLRAVYSVDPCYLFPPRAVIDRRSSWAPQYSYSTPHQHRFPLERRIKSHGLSIGNASIHPNFTFPCTFLYAMNAFRALLGHACSPTADASDPEAQLQHSNAHPQDRAWSTIAFPTLNRGSTTFSRHDDRPPPSLLPCHDTPPAYTYPPPSLPISGSDTSASRRTEVGYSRYATIAGVMLTVALFATAVYLSFFNHQKV